MGTLLQSLVRALNVFSAPFVVETDSNRRAELRHLGHGNSRTGSPTSNSGRVKRGLLLDMKMRLVQSRQVPLGVHAFRIQLNLLWVMILFPFPAQSNGSSWTGVCVHIHTQERKKRSRGMDDDLSLPDKTPRQLIKRGLSLFNPMRRPNFSYIKSNHSIGFGESTLHSSPTRSPLCGRIVVYNAMFPLSFLVSTSYAVAFPNRPSEVVPSWHVQTLFSVCGRFVGW